MIAANWLPMSLIVFEVMLNGAVLLAFMFAVILYDIMLCVERHYFSQSALHRWGRARVPLPSGLCHHARGGCLYSLHKVHDCA